tara:strand:- start:159 stop:398 length:240 start_codon:yes stop_codon:yes gene_type:complete
MEKLYDKLKPEIQESINKDLEKYPVTTDILLDSLKLHSFWSELTVDEVRTIINHSHISFVRISMNDILWGDKFLIDEEY